MIIALELLLPLFGQALDLLLKSDAPSEVTDAVSNAIDKLRAHKDDLVTKANLEAQRG